MFFFFFDGIGKLNDNRIVRDAFEKVMFSKLRSEGYCDINPLIGKPKVSKSEFENKLRQIGSPLYKLFLKKYADSEEDIEKNMSPILRELEEYTHDKEIQLDDYSYFAIVFYILQRYKSVEKKLEYIQLIYKRWDEEENDFEIKIDNGIVYNALKVEIKLVSSINHYMSLLTTLGNLVPGKKLFFRGHSKVIYDLQPSLFRGKEWLSNERKMYLELMAKCPSQFENLNSHIGKLAEMQHYGLPTRLLDITQNPLVALFFACESEREYRGEVILLAEKNDKIKYFHSDTVALLASLPLFTLDEQREFYQSSRKYLKTSSPFGKEIERLVHEVRMERPGFKSEIRPEDISSSVVCIPAKMNRRIDNQEAAFIVCGLLNEIYGNDESNSLSSLRLRNEDKKIVICIIDKKKELLKELEILGINKAKIYPEIDDVADYIKTHVDEI